MIIDVLLKFIPKVINTVLKSKAQMEKKPLPEDKNIDPKFGEYNNPSFEAQVETVGKGRSQGIMSVEASVDELYGDNKDENWKREEVARLKAEQGIIDIEEPAVNFDLEMEDNATDTDVATNNTENQKENKDKTEVEGQEKEKDQEKKLNE